MRRLLQSNPYTRPECNSNILTKPITRIFSKMTFIEAVKKVYWTNFSDFKGRASRSEYWWCMIPVVIVTTFLEVFWGSMGNAVLFSTLIISLILIYAATAALVRRAHDIGYPGWVVLCALIPILGIFVGLWITCKRGDPNENKWGLPHAVDSETHSNVRETTSTTNR